MSVEDDLRDQLNRIYGTFTPPPAPVEDTVRRGLGIRRRRMPRRPRWPW